MSDRLTATDLRQETVGVIAMEEGGEEVSLVREKDANRVGNEKDLGKLDASDVGGRKNFLTIWEQNGKVGGDKSNMVLEYAGN